MRASALLLTSSLFGACLAQDFGPISTRNHRALSLPFLRFEPRTNLLGKRERILEVSFVMANDFRDLSTSTKSVSEDYEVERLGFLYREGLGKDWEWSIELPLVHRGGGFQDPLIDWWHANILHWSDSLRDSTKFGRSNVSVPGSSFDGTATGIGDISGFVTKRLGRHWLGSAGIKLPTGSASNLIGSGGFDAGLYLQGRWALNSKWSFHAQAGVIGQGKATKLDSSRGLVHQEGFALVWQPNGRDAWIGQWQGESSAVQTGVPGSDATHRLLTFGYQRRLSAKQRLDLYFSEDRDVFDGNLPEAANIGPDFTMGARLVIRF